MGTMETSRQRDTLPSIFELDKIKTDTSRFTAMNSLNISTAPLHSPNTVYSGPPPPYSYTPSTAAPTSGLSGGYISPPESTTRRSIREDKESPNGDSRSRQSLPSIHEALGDKSLPFPTPLSATATQHPGSTPSTAVVQNFPEAPKGPSNPFSQPPPTLRENTFSSQNQPVPPPPPDLQPSKSSFTAMPSQESRQPAPQNIPQPSSPRAGAPPLFRSTYDAQTESAPPRSPVHPEQHRQPYSFPSLTSQPSASYSREPYQFTGASKHREQTPYAQGPDASYGDTVKRHLDVFDAELGLNEIADGSHRTLEFSRIWSHRYHQGNRSGYFQDSLPGVHEIDDMMQHAQRTMENLTRMREVVIVQQTALSEHRARIARGNQLEAEYNGIPDEYKGGGFAGGDAKKRRGKAAPPGRCHSCNRAETPEWRRGPDGARTLCNACGLHYAKLTRKMGVNKAASLTGSNLRPKGLNHSLDHRP